MKKAVAIYNPKSGLVKRVNQNLKDTITKIFNEYDYDVQIIITEYKGHAEEIMPTLSDDIDLVMSFGGDGTFNEIITGNVQRKKMLPIAHIPSGTANDIGAMYGYTRNMQNNIRLALEGTKKEIDICTINGAPFVYVAGYGNYTTVSYETKRELKQYLGYLAYIFRAVKEVFKKQKLHHITYEVNGEKYEGLFSLVLITNATRVGGIDTIYDDVKLNDDKFEVLFCNLLKKRDILRTLVMLGREKINNVPGLFFYKTNNIKLTITDPKAWTLDGEKFKLRTNRYEIKNTYKVPVQLPKKNINKLFIQK